MLSFLSIFPAEQAQIGAQPQSRGRWLDEPHLTKGQLKALAAIADIEDGSAFVPRPEHRPDFHALIDLDLARSCGHGLGGEGFAPTRAGRQAFAVAKARSRRGFASMSPERRREVARKGGINVEAHQRAFSKNTELASRAGKKGGAVSGVRRAQKPRDD